MFVGVVIYRCYYHCRNRYRCRYLYIVVFVYLLLLYHITLFSLSFFSSLFIYLSIYLFFASIIYTNFFSISIFLVDSLLESLIFFFYFHIHVLSLFFSYRLSPWYSFRAIAFGSEAIPEVYTLIQFFFPREIERLWVLPFSSRFHRIDYI